ncbi:MAG TPA: hypothetical protein VNU93_05385 [Verrucomicrobiae bacterium]|nr:hypothetical protein [Verrucomicrobiae bacterium]
MTLALGFSISGLVFGSRTGQWENLARYFMVGLMGIAISATCMVLIIVAVWPPYDLFSLILPFGFVMLVAGVLIFVRSTNTTDAENTAGEGEQNLYLEK